MHVSPTRVSFIHECQSVKCQMSNGNEMKIIKRNDNSLFLNLGKSRVNSFIFALKFPFLDRYCF